MGLNFQIQVTISSGTTSSEPIPISKPAEGAGSSEVRMVASLGGHSFTLWESETTGRETFVFFGLESPYQQIEIRKYLKLTESIVFLLYHYHYGKCSGVSFDYQMLPDYKLGPKGNLPPGLFPSLFATVRAFDMFIWICVTSRSSNVFILQMLK